MKKLLKTLIKLSKFNRNSISPLITITISKSSLIHNLNAFRKIVPNNTVAPVLKSNAYGHGLMHIANKLKNEKVPFFIIDSYYEAKALRNENIKTPLLIIGYSNIESIIKNNLKNISFTITSIASLNELSKNIKSETKIHLKIDTGMHRQGITIQEKEEAVKIIKNNKKIFLEGICSHLGDADNIDTSFTKNQINSWNNIVKYFKDEFPTLKYWHISNTSGHTHDNILSNMTRLGIGLYGLINIENLKPVLEMKTIITDIKKIKGGESVGYNNTFTASNDMIIATIPVGYYEGIDRRLSNKGFVKIQNIFCPIIGRVSMNITIIDISSIKNIKVGEEVIVMSSNMNDLNSIESIAKICNTISYEIAVHIPQHLKRIVIE